MDFSKKIDCSHFFREREEKQAAEEWKDDFHLLKTCAGLMDMSPGNMLRKVSWGSGETINLTSLKDGRLLNAVTRSQLQKTLNELLREERHIIEGSCQASSQLVRIFLPFSLVLGIVALLIY